MTATQTTSPGWLGWGIVGTSVVVLLVFWAFLYVVAT